MQIFQGLFLLRAVVAVILLAHSIPGMLDGGVYGFGKFYLEKQGFGALGVPLAWAIKLSHVAAAVCLVWNRWLLPAGLVTSLILLVGIFMVHLKDGWYVVGGGRNGVEFNVLLICVLITIMFPQLAQRSR